MNAKEIVLWWESRRAPYNLAVGIVGVFTCCICLICAVIISLFQTEVQLVPDPPFFAIIMVFLYAVAANVCYTGGWVIELIFYLLRRKPDPYFGPVSFVLGVALSLLVTVTPALFMVCFVVVVVAQQGL